MFFSINGKVIVQKDEELSIQYHPYLEMVIQSIESGDYHQAVKDLQKARDCYNKKKEACGFLYPDYMQLAGLVYMEFNQYERAENAFNEVLKQNPERKNILLFLGESLFRQSRYKEAVKYLKEGFEEGKDKPSYFALRSESEKRSGLTNDAADTLRTGIKLHKNNPLILRQAVVLFAENGFPESAAEILRNNRKHITESDSLYLYIAEKFIKEGSFQKAVLILEEAKIVHPSKESVAEMLAFVYAEAGMSEISGQIFKKVAKSNPEMAFNSSEQFRIAGNFKESLRVNRFIPEEKLRLKQKFMTYLSMKDFLRAYSLSFKLIEMYPDDDEILYHFAYSAFMISNYKEAVELVEKLKSDRFSSAGNQLKNAALKCLEEPHLCI